MSDESTEVLFLVKNIEEHTTKKGNECLKLHGFSPSENRSYTLWVFKDDWIEDIESRKKDYIDTVFEAGITDKSGGTRSHVWGDYFWPAEDDVAEDWFDTYLKLNDVEMDRPSEEETRERLEKILGELGMREKDGHQPDDTPEEKPSGSSSTQRPDRNTRIERQASMHFASRIVGAMIESEGRSWSDEKVEEELNKWMTKFQRGIHTGKIK